VIALACGDNTEPTPDEAPPKAAPEAPATSNEDPATEVVDGAEPVVDDFSGIPESERALVELYESLKNMECADVRSKYLEHKKAANHCKSDNECAELAGSCEFGPLYINRAADLEPLSAHEGTLNDRCATNVKDDCGGQPLGPAKCESGVCTPIGENSYQEIDPNGCRLQPFIFASANGLNFIPTSPEKRSPHMANGFELPSGGELTIQATWPKGCTDCSLHVFAEGDLKNTDLTKKTNDTKTGATYRGSLSKGTYRIAAVSEKENETVQIDQVYAAADGTPIKSSSLGMVWQKFCP